MKPGFFALTRTGPSGTELSTTAVFGALLRCFRLGFPIVKSCWFNADGAAFAFICDLLTFAGCNAGADA